MIDSTVIAQVITTLLAFGIFFLIAKKMFWTSILSAIEERQTRIKSEFDRIDLLQKQADTMQADYSRRLAEIEAEARTKMQEEISRGRQVAMEIEEQARQHAAEALERNKQTLALEMEKLRAELKHDVVRMTLSATEKVIRQRMDDASQRQQVSQFVEELSRR